MSDNKFNHISDGLNTAAEATQTANDTGLKQASGWLRFLSAIASIFASKKSGRS